MYYLKVLLHLLVLGTVLSKSNECQNAHHFSIFARVFKRVVATLVKKELIIVLKLKLGYLYGQTEVINLALRNSIRLNFVGITSKDNS